MFSHSRSTTAARAVPLRVRQPLSPKAPVAFLPQGTVSEIRADIGLTPQGISRRTIEFAAAVLGRGEPSGAEGVLSQPPELSATDDRRE